MPRGRPKTSKTGLSYAEIGEAVGVSAKTVANYAKLGVDINDMDAIAAAKKKYKDRIPDMPDADDDDAEGEVIPHYEISRAKWKAEQARKLKIDADKAAGEVIERAAVQQDFYRIGVAIKNAMYALETTLPPLLYGQEPGEMSRRIRAETHEIVKKFNDELSGIYG